ncbi:MAG: putative porin [Ignavibacteriae bacterium]|nr:putative porin [Ignavibacteriota bacterium]
MNKYFKYFLIVSILFSNSLFANISLNNYLADSTKTHTIIDSSRIIDSLQIDTTNIQKKVFLFSPPTDSINNSRTLSSFSLNKKKIDRLDYKSTGNIITFLPFGFLNDLGHTGLPNEPKLYGYGNGNSSINIDGISYNNRWKNNFDLNNIQTESIGAISLAPLPRGFLFNVANNPVTLSISKSDTLGKQPISRIRYYQGGSNEAFIDAMFSAKVLPRLVFLFRVTNVGTSDRFENTEYSTWKANFKLMYKLSENLYSSLDYNYIKSASKLNGGVNIDSILTTTNDYEPILYSTTFAPVYFSSRSLTTINQNIHFEVFGKIIGNNLSKIIFGYEDNLNEFRQNITKAKDDSTRFYNNNKYNLYSLQLEQELSFEKLYSKFFARYEFSNFDITDFTSVTEQTNYYAWMLLNYNLLNGKITPSIFGKYLDYDGQSKSGFGIDITAHPFSFVEFYVGFSSFGKPYSILEKASLPIDQFNKDQTVSTFLTSAKFNYLFTKTSISYFESSNDNAAIPVFTNSLQSLSTSHITYTFTDNISNKGINISSENEFSSFLTSLNFNYYFENNSKVPTAPEYSLVAGLYYVDTLFNSNLNLKTGFTFYLNSEVDYRVYDFQCGQSANLYLDDNVAKPFTYQSLNNNSSRLDFILAGRIQDKATFYFTFENLLDNQYYIIPFYPMHPRGVRIGLSWDFIN